MSTTSSEEDVAVPRQASDIWAPPLDPVTSGGMARPRIGIAGIAIESSTFSPHRAALADFTVRRGEELLEYYGFLSPGDELREAAKWVPILQARSLPGGAVTEQAYRDLSDEIIEGARQGHFDGFFLDIHGAMSVFGIDDAEADLARRIREVVGVNTLITTSMDLHGNVSRELVEAVDLITCYRMAPHEDEQNTRHRAVRNALAVLRSEQGADPVARRPFLAWVPVPVLLPGEKTSTRIEPAKSLYAQIPEVEAMPEVLDAAIWVGYPWADEPRCQAAVVVSGWDQGLIAKQAERLARHYWDAREDFRFVADALPLEDALDAAVAWRGAYPYVISDSGDNPTAGGAGDVTWTLTQVLRRPEFAGGQRSLVYASIFDADAVAACERVGVGGQVDLVAGARVDAGPSPAVALRGEVISITAGDSVAGTQVVVRVGDVLVIITERRKPFHLRTDFTMLGVTPEEHDVLIVKIGYLEPELYQIAAAWTLGLTPGGVDQDLSRLGHRRLGAGVYPFQIDGEPELRAVVLRGSSTQNS